MIPDTFGHCTICHKNMLIEQVIDGKVEKRFTPEYVENEYLLSDGSKMRVAMCRDCKSNLTFDKQEQIMNCVIKGWEVGIKDLSWTDEKKKAYMDRYSKLEIIVGTEDISKDVMDKCLDGYNLNKVE